jgi:transketolase
MSEKMMYGASLKGMRATLGETLLDIGRKNKKAVVIDCETGTATNILEFRDTFPDRFVTVGVAEQSGISFAFGAARAGYVPIVPLFGSFLTRRALDQIFIQIGYAEANIKLIGCYSGLTTPNTGATHQSINDISIMRSIPNITVIETADPFELKQALYAMMEVEGPVYLRMIRGDIEKYDVQCVPENHQFTFGKSSVLKTGKDITLIGSGLMVSRCLEAAEILGDRGIEAEVINMSAIKPVDAETLAGSVRKTGGAVTAENHSVIGGVGSAVLETLSAICPVPVKRVGIMDRYGESAALKDLFEKYGLTSSKVVDAAMDIIGQRTEV